MLTLATVGYAAQAVATLRSARRTGEYASCHLFAVDAQPAAVAELRVLLGEDASWLDLFGPHDLRTGMDRFLAAFEYYNAMEVCCLAKFVGIQQVLGTPSSGDICVCLDADMRFFGDVRDTVNAMGERAVLLTPHLLGPTRDDMEHDIMTHGWMNAGFVAFRKDHKHTGVILDWLLDRISRRGFLAPQFGLSYDQKWVSGLPTLFPDDTYLCRHPGLNVGYWNVDERPITDSGNTFCAAGTPLLVFHYSGFDSNRPSQLSKYANVPVLPGSALEAVCKLFQVDLPPWHAEKELRNMPTIPASQATVLERIRVGSARNQLNIINPTARLGTFARLGGILDSLTRRAMPWVRA